MVRAMATTINADDLLADLDSLTPGVGGHTCHAGAAIATLPPEVLAAIDPILDRSEITSTSISEVLARHGLTIRIGSLARHRRRGTPSGCLCPRASEDYAP